MHSWAALLVRARHAFTSDAARTATGWPTSRPVASNGPALPRNFSPRPLALSRVQRLRPARRLRATPLMTAYTRRRRLVVGEPLSPNARPSPLNTNQAADAPASPAPRAGPPARSTPPTSARSSFAACSARTAPPAPGPRSPSSLHPFGSAAESGNVARSGSRRCCRARPSCVRGQRRRGEVGEPATLARPPTAGGSSSLFQVHPRPRTAVVGVRVPVSAASAVVYAPLAATCRALSLLAASLSTPSAGGGRVDGKVSSSCKPGGQALLDSPHPFARRRSAAVPPIRAHAGTSQVGPRAEVCRHPHHRHLRRFRG